MNIINHLEFTIKSARKLPFFSGDYELSEWVREAALPVVDEVFSQMDFSNGQVVIENLVLDMGEFSENNFCSDLPEKLSISLKTALEAHLATSSTVNNTLSGNQLDAFFQEAYGLAEIDIFKQWHQLNPVSQSASHKVLLIKLRDSKVRQVIAKRFPEKIQQDIFQLLEPANFNIIIDVLSNSYLFENNNLYIVNSEKGSIDNRLKLYLVEMTLSYLALTANNQFSCKEYLHYLLHHIAQQQNRDYDDLLKLLNQRIKTTTLANKLKKNITYLANLRQTLDEQGVSVSTKIDNNKDSRSLLIELLCCVLNNGKWSLLQAYWSELTSDYVAEVKKIVLKEGRSFNVRQNISKLFPETAFKDIVEIVVPRHFSYVNKIISQSSLLRQGEYLAENLFIHSEGKTFNDKLNMLFKQSTLNYLFTENGIDFNKKTYLRSLLRQIAESVSIHYDDLLAKLYHTLKTNFSDSELTQGLLEILGANITTPAQKVTFDSAAEKKLSAGYRLYNRLYTLIKDAVKNDSRVEHSEWNKTISQLENNYPVQLQRFFRELQFDALNRENLYTVLEADSLRLCSVIYIRICRHINDKDDFLLRSIDSYSEKSTDKKSYYKHLLSAVLDRQLIDLEKITQLSASVRQHKEKNIKQRAYKANQQRQIDELTIQLKSIAKTDEFSDERYQRLLRDLLQDQPAVLDRQLIDLEKITQLSASVRQHKEKNIKQRAYKANQQRQIDELTIQLKSIAKTDEFSDERYQRLLRDLLQDQPAVLDRQLIDLEKITQLSASVRQHKEKNIKQRAYKANQQRQIDELTIQLKSIAKTDEFSDERYQRLLRDLLQDQPAVLDRQLIDLEKNTQLSASVRQHKEKNIKQRAYKANQQRQIDELTIQLKSIAKTDEFSDERYQRLLRDLLQDQQQIELLSYLPEDSLCQFCYKRSPAVFAEAITLGEQLRLAFLNKQLDLSVKEISQIHWQSILLYTSEAKDYFSADRFIQIYMRQLNNRVDLKLNFIKPIVTQQLVLNQTDSDQAHLRSLIKVIDSISEHDLKGDKVNLNHEIDEPENQTHQAEDFSLKTGDMIPVHNCGLVLATCYIPLLFNRLKFTDSGQFISAQHAHKAVHLLHYLVYGEVSIETCDFQLEKLICGLALNSEINVDYEIKESEKELIDSLLTDLIHSWSAIGKTSIEGLRETFLQRDGSLIKRDEKSWKLVVQPSPFDMLLDRMPWSYANIKHSFMQDLIYVEWRSGADR